MNIRERVDGENKKHNDSILYYALNLSSACQEKCR